MNDLIEKSRRKFQQTLSQKALCFRCGQEIENFGYWTSDSTSPDIQQQILICSACKKMEDEDGR